MPAARTIRLLAVTPALFLLLVSGSPAGSSPPPRSLFRAGTWTFGVIGASARQNVLTDVAMAVPAARPVLDLVEGSIAIDGNAATCPQGSSCSFAAPLGSATPWRIHLDHSVTWDAYKSLRFVVLHEIGHAVWGMVLSNSDRQAFIDDVARSLAGKACRGWPDGRPCASINEMFADEFARWAGGFAVSLSYYQTPPLLSTSTFADIIDRAVEGHKHSRRVFVTH